MTHLTLTGYEAGRVICGAAKTADSQYLHAMYAPQALIDSDECCSECRKLWNEAGQDDEQEAEQKRINSLTTRTKRCPTCYDIAAVRGENQSNCPDVWHNVD